MTENKFIPHTPTPRQAAFLGTTGIEALYGGAAGGGKSDALLMAALQFVDREHYAALILRRTFADLTQPSSLIPRSIAWLGGSSARYSGSEHAWKFPSGAILKFGYLDAESDVYQYQSAEFQCICFDELTQFREKDYRYMFSRLRKPDGMDLPLRMRTASNPGGMGHDWVKRRFITDADETRLFIPAKLADNPYLNRESYLKSLSHLDPITRSQLERGDWTARAAGKIFRREWFKKLLDSRPRWRWDGICRFWDLAATDEDEGGDPAWTCGVLLGLHDGLWFVLDVRRIRGSPLAVEQLVAQTASIDPRETKIRMEQEPGSGGKNTIFHYATRVLIGFDFAGIPPVHDKVTRAAPVSSAVEAGNVVLINGPWVSDYLDEFEAFPDGKKDQVDATSGAFNVLSVGEQVMLA